jgi:hypothetical protein
MRVRCALSAVQASEILFVALMVVGCAGSGGTPNTPSSAGTGGSAAGTGGSAGIAAAGNGGAGGGGLGNGGSPGSGGSGKGGTGGVSTGGAIGSGGSIGTGGTPGKGGASGKGGAGISTDGSADDATSGVDSASSGCPGVPIVPDSGGSVAVGSNTVGIHGSWFVYSDCTDLKGVNCAMVTSPGPSTFPNVGGKMCTSGRTSDAAGAWGAGIALELSDGPPQQPYDTTLHGVRGFCFQLTGATIPSTTIRVAFPTKDNNDNAYFESVSTPGTHTVLFSDTAQGSWVTTKSQFEPTKVMLIQFQIPSATTAPVPWDFCVEGLTALNN